MSEYLIVLLLSIAVPAGFAAHPALRLYRRWRRLLFAILVPSLAYATWDVAATARGHWSFTGRCVYEARLFGLPIEEYLFYPVIAFLAVYTWEVVIHFRKETR